MGYHAIIDKNGKITELATPDKICNGVQGYNSHSYHVSTIGGLKVDDRTKEQKDALYFLLKGLQKEFPNAVIRGHRDFPNVKKACPRYDANKWFSEYIPYE
jgi:N-acetylmuramoyl-L-alanine amidase